jgi:hypothetical protein
MSETLVHQTPNIMDQARNTRLGRIVATGLTAVALIGAVEGVTGADEAQATAVPVETKTYKDGNTEFTETTSSRVLVGGASMSAQAFSNIRVVGNLRTVSKAKIRKLKRQGKCDSFTGKEAMEMGMETMMHSGNYALENRKSTFCDSNGDGVYDVRAECGNKARGRRPQPKKAKNILWVKNFNNAKVDLRSSLRIEARSGCELNVEGGRVTAIAYGSAADTASARMTMRAATRAHGKGLTLVKNSQVGSMKISLKQAATADARTLCVSKGGKVVPPPPKPPERPPKDGTETPPPPPEAPGPNPNPDPEEPYPGGYACYDEDSGAPVIPVDGLCPPGSWGSPVNSNQTSVGKVSFHEPNSVTVKS